MPPWWNVVWLLWASCMLWKCSLVQEETCLHSVFWLDPAAASLPSPPAAAAAPWANSRGRRAGRCAAGGGASLGWGGPPSLGSSAPPAGRCWNLRPGSSDTQPGGTAAAAAAPPVALVPHLTHTNAYLSQMIVIVVIIVCQLNSNREIMMILFKIKKKKKSLNVNVPTVITYCTRLYWNLTIYQFMQQ